MLGGALELPHVGEVGRAAGRDDARLEPERAHALRGLVEEALRLRPRRLGRIEQKAVEAQAGLLLDEPRQLDRLLGGLDAGALAARVALDDDAERAPGDLGRLRQTGDGRRVVGGDDDLRALQQPAQAAHLLLAQQIVADEDVVDAAVDHHLGLAQLLAGDALGAGRDLHLGEHGALVRLDVRPVGDAGLVAQLLHAGDVGLDPVEIDHHRRRAELARDLGLEAVDAHRRVPSGHSGLLALEASCAIARQAPRLNSAGRATAEWVVGENGWNTPRRLR